ncbi:MAG: sulfurtransferase [Rickettsiales bacterium]|nr:sulfurtransferase [Rickettsiales bacterium]OUV54055.1 MAG: hypothetical protein CBC87_01880 [Rickettsiales bacterium TMED127]|tara:strand:- start:31290 stop:31715 length:426 start_codon:yes stop_codon:yes gene_type:complete
MNKLDYAGDLSPAECWDILKKDKNSQLIDCRTKAECQFTGVPNLEELEKITKFIEWQIYPSMVYNENFLSEFEQLGFSKSDKIILICRSGGRSKSAAEFLSSKGYESCFNCLNGFEGAHNLSGQRGQKDGWKFDGLPWKQT